MPGETQTQFPTTIWAQCRNEQPFPVVIHFYKGRPIIACPHCQRGYVPEPDGRWSCDRDLKFLDFPNEVEEARKTAIG